MSVVTIEVTEEDIAAGWRCWGDRCPVANALRRAFPAASPVRVAGFYLRLGMVRIDLPDSECVAIAAFDRGLGMTPHRFEIDVP